MKRINETNSLRCLEFNVDLGMLNNSGRRKFFLTLKFFHNKLVSRILLSKWFFRFIRWQPEIIYIKKLSFLSFIFIRCFKPSSPLTPSGVCE